jgi:hypothetical protein
MIKLIAPLTEATIARPFWKAVIWTAYRMLEAAGSK